MPIADSRQPLRRQWHLLQLLPMHGHGMTSREANLALQQQGFTVDKRTTERDLRMLEELALVQGEGQNPCLWRRPASQHLQMAMTTAEALGLSLLEQQLKPLLPASLLQVLEGQFARARQLLEEDKRFNRHASLMDKVRIIPPCFLLQPPTIGLPVLEAVQQAVAESIPLAVDYQGLHDDQPRRRSLMPLGLLQEAQITYLIGRDPGSTQNKLFALHRMSYAEVLHGEPLDDISDFDIDAYLAAGHGQFYTRETMQLHATVTDQLARILSETPLSPTMRLSKNQENNEWEVVDNLPDTALFRRWLIIHKDMIKIINKDVSNAR